MNTKQNAHIYIGESHSGRYAILVRKGQDSPWVQIESASSEESADELIRMYDLDDDNSRGKFIDEVKDEEENSVDWGDDAPINPPTS